MARCTLRLGSFNLTPWAPSAVQRGRPPRAREDAEPIRVGALGREHLLMAPPAAAPAAAPTAVAEPSVPTPATESSAAAAQSSSSSSTPSPAAGAPDREVEMTNSVPDRKRGHSAVDPSSPAAAEDDRGPRVIEDKRQRLQEKIAVVAAECQDEAPIEWDEDEERVCRTSHSESSAIDRSTSLTAADTQYAVSSRSSQVQRISMLPLLCHAWLRPSSSVRNEKGTRCALGTAQMRFCRATCWKRSTLNP